MTQRTEEEIRAEIAETRSAMAETVDKLGHRLDVKARVRDRVTRARGHHATGSDMLVPAVAAAATMLLAGLAMGVRRSRQA